MKIFLTVVAVALLCSSETAVGHNRRHGRLHKRILQSSVLIDGSTIPKYVTDLVIPPVLFDDKGKLSRWEIGFRQFEQQVLPPGYPKTINWGYGDPSRPGTFNNPSFTIEVTRNVKTYITWRNELVVDPIACRASGYSATNPACNYVPHILQDRNFVPVVDQSLHWANPNRLCRSGEVKTDCEGASTEPYRGPIPIVTHVHGAHTESLSDGYASAWYLPKASNIPAGYATEGEYFRSRFLPSARVKDEGDKFVDNAGEGDKFFAKAAKAARGQGYAVYRYTNDQDTCTLFYHDHALGMTRLNVYGGGAGFWLIRTANDGENRLAPLDAKGNVQLLPGPPAKLGDDPNGDFATRSQIREIPIAIQDKSFYQDGRQFYPADRAYFDLKPCSDGTIFGGTNIGLPFRPNSDVPPVWNPEVYLDTFVVNGNTFPKLAVAPQRYRFRIVNACDSRPLNLVLKIGNVTGTELPLFVIGTEQGLLPQVVKVTTGFATALIPGSVTPDTPTQDRLYALFMTPGERYDVIVDFAGLTSGTEVFLVNTGPDEPLGLFTRPTSKTAQVMKFVVDAALAQSADASTSPYDLQTINGSLNTPKPTKNPRMLKPTGKKAPAKGAPVKTAAPVKAPTSKAPTSKAPTSKAPTVKGLPKNFTIRDVALTEVGSKACLQANSTDSCALSFIDCPVGATDPLTGISFLPYYPIKTLLGYNGSLGPALLKTQKWMDPIQQNPPLGATEIWEIWNWTPATHPIHFHLVSFTLLGRYDFNGKLVDAPLPYERHKKDTVTVLAGQVTKIQITFDVSGYFVWHCHTTSHEDNEMMVPYCVGRKGIDCPLSLF